MASWPPESLASNPEGVLNECELMEMLPQRGEGKQFVPVVELATCLFTGDYISARHVWRRWKHSDMQLLLDWWKVGAAMMSNDAKILWEGLVYIQANHPAPLSLYAQEVATVYRKRILQSYPPSPPYLALLNFASQEELQQFYQEHQFHSKDTVGVASGTTSLRQVVAFLENNPPPMNAKS